MFKNVASQKLAIFAFDVTTGLPKTGDAANITAYVSKDWGAVTVLGDTSATEMDATNAKGMYLFDLAQAETNANTLIFSGKSVTANVVLVSQVIATLPANFTATGIDSSGNVTANVTQRLGIAEKPRYVGVAAGDGGSTNTIQLQAGTTALQCEAGDLIELTGNLGAGGSNYVSTYVPATQIATCLFDWLTTPSSGTNYEITKQGGGVPATPQDVLSAFPLSTNGNLKADVVEAVGILLQTGGSGTQNIGGP